METKLITDFTVEEAAADALAEIVAYAKHGMKRSDEQIAQIIADYSNNNDRTIEISIIVWPKVDRS